LNSRKGTKQLLEYIVGRKSHLLPIYDFILYINRKFNFSCLARVVIHFTDQLLYFKNDIT